tara:strand:+ start:12784 stop:13008 length:225 start_codon:yes stop_codon:yes gene_type:complete
VNKRSEKKTAFNAPPWAAFYFPKSTRNFRARSFTTNEILPEIKNLSESSEVSFRNWKSDFLRRNGAFEDLLILK